MAAPPGSPPPPCETQKERKKERNKTKYKHQRTNEGAAAKKESASFVSPSLSRREIRHPTDRRLPDDRPICFVIGAMAAGHISVDDHPTILEMVSLSEFPLSGSTAINRLLGAIEANWGVY